MESFKTNRSDKKERGSAKIGGITLIGLAALSALGISRSHDAPAPTPEPQSYTDLAQESAQTPYDPAADELVVGGIKIKPGNPDRNTPSEAVLNHPEVKEYLATNPDEVAAVESSALSLPSNATGEYVVSAEDIDGDGDLDSVAKSKE
jgi:hypothetical protein